MGGQTNEIDGLEYVPRKSGANGRIGQFEIYTSTDGSTFAGDPVAEGRWEDTSANKIEDFPAVECKAVKLVALTEAGGRAPFSSAAEIYLLGSAGATPDHSEEGKWDDLIPLPLVPVAAAVTPDNKARSLDFYIVSAVRVLARALVSSAHACVCWQACRSACSLGQRLPATGMPQSRP